MSDIAISFVAVKIMYVWEKKVHFSKIENKWLKNKNTWSPAAPKCDVIHSD